MVESWFKIIVPSSDDEPLWIYNLIAHVGSVYERSQNPPEFWVYHRYDDDQTPYRNELYFSPEAARRCSNLIAPFHPIDCGVPLIDDSFTLRSGDDSELKRRLQAIR
jgi:hypothetical protein